jgi:hypothetical protein
MSWFPEPAHVDPQAATFLEMELQYLTGHWALLKILIATPVPFQGFFCFRIFGPNGNSAIVKINIFPFQLE